MRVFFLNILLFLALDTASGQGFVEVSRASGIDAAYQADFLMGGGAAFFDYNNDGDLDIYVVTGNGIDHLYRNNGDGTFTDVAADAGLGLTENYYTMGVVTGDIDNDGDKDIFVTTWGSKDGVNVVEKYARNLLYFNNGDGTFTEDGAESGILEGAWSASASMGDVNLDGYLDIYVANYVINHGPLELNDDGTVRFYAPDCFTNFFYLNNGDGTFTESYPVYFDDTDKGCGLAVAMTDYNDDAHTDLLVANDFGWWAEANRLYANRYPEEEFSDVSQDMRASIPMFGMGIAIGDYDEDLDLDYYVTNIRGNVLMRNDGFDGFKDVGAELEIDNPKTGDLFTTGWGAIFFDYNNNSYLDLAVANGWVATEPIVFTSKQDEDKIFINNGDGTFSDQSSDLGFNSTEISRGLIYGDIDNDGDLDLLVNVVEDFESTDPHILLYRNDSDSENNWVKVRLQGVETNRDGYGSRVNVFFDDRVLVRELTGGSTFASQNSDLVHVGLGTASEVDSIEVIWPNGRRQILKDVNVNDVNVIQEDITLDINVVTSVENDSDLLASQINVYPIPSEDGQLFVNLAGNYNYQDFEIGLQTLDGKELMPDKLLVNGQTNTIEINLPNIPNGIYILAFKSEQLTFRKRVILNR